MYKYKQTLFYYGGQRLKELTSDEKLHETISVAKKEYKHFSWYKKLNIRTSTISLHTSWTPTSMRCRKCGCGDIQYWGIQNKKYKMCDSCLY
ncbi:MAG: hypothetical protein ACRC5M_00725 [Anaeroplasmataceae bacterium]